TDEIKETKAYKDYDADYKSVVVPMIQPQQKKEKVVGVSSEPEKHLRIKITTKRLDPVIPVPTSSEIERAKHLKGVVARMSRQKTYMVQNMKKTFLQRSNVDKWCSKITTTLDEEVPIKVVETTDQILKDNLR
ncbi:hypothetical protein Tco_0055799, partial [Tanacetum coccineum]